MYDYDYKTQYVIINLDFNNDQILSSRLNVNFNDLLSI